MLLPTFDYRFLENSYILRVLCSAHIHETYFKYVNGTVNALNNCEYVFKTRNDSSTNGNRNRELEGVFYILYSQYANATPVFTPSFLQGMVK